jgi:hypothetical protein
MGDVLKTETARWSRASMAGTLMAGTLTAGLES